MVDDDGNNEDEDEDEDEDDDDDDDNDRSTVGQCDHVMADVDGGGRKQAHTEKLLFGGRGDGGSCSSSRRAQIVLGEGQRMRVWMTGGTAIGCDDGKEVRRYGRCVGMQVARWCSFHGGDR